MKDEWWLSAAITDDTLVAELLIRLKDESSTSTPSNPNPLSLLSRPSRFIPSWGYKQPRSDNNSNNNNSNKKRERERERDREEKETPRRSPTTPLSISSWCSPSDGCDDSSCAAAPSSLPSDRPRSKVCTASETPTLTGRRPRRKKTFTELKEEEGSLLKERTYLKKELATLRITLKEQRSINENLKRMKLDWRVESGVKAEANSSEREEQNSSHNGSSEAGSSFRARQVKAEVASLHGSSCSNERNCASQNAGFALPDLNMTPEEEGLMAMC